MIEEMIKLLKDYKGKSTFEKEDLINILMERRLKVERKQKIDPGTFVPSLINIIRLAVLLGVYKETGRRPICAAEYVNI